MKKKCMFIFVIYEWDYRSIGKHEAMLNDGNKIVQIAVQQWILECSFRFEHKCQFIGNRFRSGEKRKVPILFLIYFQIVWAKSI